MHKISIEQGLRALQRFILGEWRLALPIALAFLAVPPFALIAFVEPLMPEMPSTVEGIRALSLAMPGWVTPLMGVTLLFMIVGAMALQALLLLPRISVGEAILAGLRRLPAWIGAWLILIGALCALLMLVGFLSASIQAVALTMLIGMVAVGLSMVLVMPLIVDRQLGPVAALREGFAFYGAQLPRVVGGLILFLVGAWVVAMAIQVALGSVLLLLARLLGQPELGQTLVTLLGALVSSAEWGAFYLLVGCFYRQRARG